MTLSPKWKNPLAWPIRYRILSIVLVLALVFGGILTFRFVVLSAEFNHFYAEIQEQYVGDVVEIMIACLEDEQQSLDNKNHAIWFVGQFGDTRALPALRTLHTGEPCDHSHVVCQREVNRAIQALEDGGEPPRLWTMFRNATHPAFRDI